MEETRMGGRKQGWEEGKLDFTTASSHLFNDMPYPNHFLSWSIVVRYCWAIG